MAVISFSLAPISISKERRELITSGTTMPETFEEYQYWIYNYILYQKTIKLDNPITQQLIRYAGGTIEKKITMLGDIYYTINITYTKVAPLNWKEDLKSILELSNDD